MGAKGSEGIKVIGAGGPGAVVGGAEGTDGGTDGAIGDRSSSGISAAVWSSSGLGGGK